jgi:hypothetical protein
MENINNTDLRYWPTEAITRRFYDVCGLDQCQAENDELYYYLAYYSAARNDRLDNAQLTINDIVDAAPKSSYYQTELDNLNSATAQFLNPPNAWMNGVQDNTPYGFGTRVNVANAEADNLETRLSHCNPQRFAFSYPVDEMRQNIFFGTTVTTDRKEIIVPGYENVVCRF